MKSLFRGYMRTKWFCVLKDILLRHLYARIRDFNYQSRKQNMLTTAQVETVKLLTKLMMV